MQVAFPAAFPFPFGKLPSMAKSSVVAKSAGRGFGFAQC